MANVADISVKYGFYWLSDEQTKERKEPLLVGKYPPASSGSFWAGPCAGARRLVNDGAAVHLIVDKDYMATFI